jgi:DHA2 family multidrug resistance protein-like MFS transporter
LTNPSPVREAGALAGRREWLGLAVLGLPTMLLSLDLGVLYLALPQLSADLAPSSTQTLWIMDIYAFMTASFLITMGTLGDRIGRRKLLMIGAAAFGTASLLAAYASSAEMLIAARALLGIAGATLGPSTLSLISNMFANARQRGIAIGIWMSCFMVGAAIGPVVGGLLLHWFWWGSAFLIGLPVMLLLVVAAPILLPEFRFPDAGRLDPISVALSLATMLPVVYGIKKIAHDGLSTLALLSIAVGVVAGLAFVLRQRKLTQPLIDVRLFTIPSFAGAIGILVLGPAVMGGIGLFVNQYLQMVRELSPLQAGLLTAPPAIGTAVGAMLAPVVAQRVGSKRVVVGAGAVILAVGALTLSMADVSYSLALLVAGLTLVSFGFGPMASLGTELIIAAAPPEKAGAAASISQTSSEFGIGLGVGVLGVVGTAVYRGGIADSLPAGLPAQAADAARDTLAGAISAAGQMPGELGPAVLNAARQAFTSGLDTVAATCAGIGVVLVLLSTLLVRTGDPGADPARPEPATPPAEPAEYENRVGG